MFLKAGIATITLFVVGLTLGFGANWFNSGSQTYDLVWTEGGASNLNVLGMTRDACEKMLTSHAQAEAKCRKQPFLQYVADSF